MNLFKKNNNDQNNFNNSDAIDSSALANNSNNNVYTPSNDPNDTLINQANMNNDQNIVGQDMNMNQNAYQDNVNQGMNQNNMNQNVIGQDMNMNQNTYQDNMNQIGNQNIIGQDSNMGQDNFQPVAEKKDSKTKTIIIIIVAVVLIVFLFIYFKFLKIGTIDTISTNVPDVIYTEEKTDFTTEVRGSGNLKKTIITFYSSDPKIANIEKSQIEDIKGINTISPNESGQINLKITAYLGDKNKIINKQIAVCNHFKTVADTIKDINLKLNCSVLFKLNLGNNKRCYQNINYTIADPSIATINEANMITGLKRGSTIMTISDGFNTKKVKINVTK